MLHSCNAPLFKVTALLYERRPRSKSKLTSRDHEQTVLYASNLYMLFTMPFYAPSHSLGTRASHHSGLATLGFKPATTSSLHLLLIT